MDRIPYDTDQQTRVLTTMAQREGMDPRVLLNLRMTICEERQGVYIKPINTYLNRTVGSRSY
jgi:hypothetical protein